MLIYLYMYIKIIKKTGHEFEKVCMTRVGERR